MFSSTPRPYFTPGKDPVPIVQEAGWAPEPGWTGRITCPTGIRSPDHPAHSSFAIPTELPDPHKLRCIWYWYKDYSTIPSHVFVALVKATNTCGKAGLSHTHCRCSVTCFGPHALAWWRVLTWCNIDDSMTAEPDWRMFICSTTKQYEHYENTPSSRGTVLFSGLLDLSLSWGFLGRIKEEIWNAAWKTSIWYCGVVFVVHRDRLVNWFLALTWLQGPDYCPLIGHNPGLLLACLLDITPWEDIYV